MSSEQSIFSKIGRSVFEGLQQDATFTPELAEQIKELFDTGEIANHDSVLNLLQGESSEDSRTRD